METGFDTEINIGKKRYTGTEILSVMLIIILAAAALVSVFFSALSLYNNYAANQKDKILATEILEIIDKNLRESFSVDITDSSSEPLYLNNFSVKNGKLLLNGESIYEKTAERDRRVVITAIASKLTLTVKVEITDSDRKILCSETKALRVNMLQVFHTAVEGKTYTELVNPNISFKTDYLKDYN